MPEAGAYISGLGAPPRNAMTCREAPHCLHGEHPATSFGPGGCAKLRRLPFSCRPRRESGRRGPSGSRAVWQV